MKRMMASIVGMIASVGGVFGNKQSEMVITPADHEHKPSFHSRSRSRSNTVARSSDLRGVSGQGRIAARYFRKLEENQVRNGRRKLYPCK